MATKFHFSLEKILKLRQALENSQAMQLEKSRRELENEQHTLSAIQEEKAHHLNQKMKMGHQLSLFNLSVSEGYLQSLNHGLEEQSKRVAQYQKKVEKKQEELTQAARDKKVMESLKSKKWEGYKKELNRKELLISSEIALRMGMNK